MADHRFDIAIVGGGILGAATALQLSGQYPRCKVGVLEKEGELAAHQTGHNSGVIHSGIYYKPGSLKVKNCVAGARALMRFCQENGIPYELCGKLVVATTQEEIPRLHELHRRGTANGVEGLRLIGPEEIEQLEPHAKGLMGLHSPNTGIVDYKQVTLAYARKFVERGGTVLTGARVDGIQRHGNGLVLRTSQGDVNATYLINCGGLRSDQVARKMGVRYALRIVPFRGEYYVLTGEARGLVKGLIYPVPDPRFPFLGVHFTKTIHGDVEAGPNAVLALAREGYGKLSLNPLDTLGTVGYRGFWAMSARYWRTGMGEVYRSLSKAAFTRALRKLVPEIESHHLKPAEAGVRAQAVQPNGLLVDDFRIVEVPNAIHVLNAPSPGATASLAIGADIVAMAGKAFHLAP